MGSLSYCLEHIYRPFEARSLNYNIINLSVLVCLLRGASLSLDCMGKKRKDSQHSSLQRNPTLPAAQSERCEMTRCLPAIAVGAIQDRD